MAHCDITQLQDLLPLFDEMSIWEGLRIKSPGVFYFKSTPFLHFHITKDKSGKESRFADIKKKNGDWLRISFPFHPTKTAKAKFLKIAIAHYVALARPK